jgi:hypothetical protein
MKHGSPIFEMSDVCIDQKASLSPMSYTCLGNGLNQDQLGDFSMAAAEMK